jgi:DNA-binding NarL/FixJ family response regulator
MATKITIVLADDHTLVREGLRALLEAAGDMEVVGEAATGRQAVELTERFHPDVVVMDIGMPLLNGFEAARRILKFHPQTRVLMLSAHADDVYVRQVAGIGVSGYVIKQTSAEVLVQAVREAARGGVFYSPSLVRSIRQSQDRTNENDDLSKGRGERLSPREMEVLQMIAESLANKQIAAELGISIKTVEKHRGRLMQKLDIHDTAGLARHAIAAGVIENRVRYDRS